MNMTEQIQEAITKTLPSQVGEALQKELKRLAMLELDIESKNKRIEIFEKNEAVNALEITNANSKLALHEAINKRIADVFAREQKQDLRDLEVKLADLRRADAVGLVHAIFKSPVFTETVSSMVPVVIPTTSQGQYGPTTSAFVQKESSSTTTVKSQS
jgi:hypothetical protein